MSINVAIVIPAYREHLYIEKTLASIEKSIEFASQMHPCPTVIVVVNNPAVVSQDIRVENQRMIRLLTEIKEDFSFALHILDYTDPGLAFGVGQARKLGMEYAIYKLQLEEHDRLVCLDADTLVNDAYIHSLFTEQTVSSAFTINFEHPLTDSNMIVYELYLRYLSLALHKANSPFDFIAVGSALGCNVDAYQKSGGMPAKSATEDFHFLNKLRKQSPIAQLKKAKVFPSDRRESKTSLGRGAFLQSASRNIEHPLEKLVLPSPSEIERLKNILQVLNRFYEEDSLLDLFEQINEPWVYQALHDRSLVEKLFSIKENTATPAMYQKRMLEVIDGLETIRLLRIMGNTRKKVNLAQFQQWAQSLIDCAHTESWTDLLQRYR